MESSKNLQVVDGFEKSVVYCKASLPTATDRRVQEKMVVRGSKEIQ